MKSDIYHTEKEKLKIGNNSSLRSDALNEQLSRRPELLVRWALLILTTIFIGLLMLLSVIQYPDVFNGQAKIFLYKGRDTTFLEKHLVEVKIRGKGFQNIVAGQMVILHIGATTAGYLINVSGKIISVKKDLVSNSFSVFIYMNESQANNKYRGLSAFEESNANVRVITEKNSLLQRLYRRTITGITS